MGDPAGIGPEVVLKAVAEEEVRKVCVPVIIGDAQLLAHTARTLDLQSGYDIVRKEEPFPEELTEPVIFHLDNISGSIEPGIESGAAGKAAAGYIEAAVELCAAGNIDAIATAPINKRALFLGGYSFPGHTEFLARLVEQTSGKVLRPVMMLWSPELAVVPVTIHLPLREIFKQLSIELVVETGRIVARDLHRRFGLARPRLAIAGLNPHAGEAGTLGDEDRAIVAPAVAALVAEDIDAKGPLPADSMFHEAARASYDAALCMYHDQALIPIKTLAFDHAVNVTLGLPFVRTSPDHGTAFDIAGTGAADPASLIAALRLAARLAASPGAGASAEPATANTAP